MNNALEVAKQLLNAGHFHAARKHFETIWQNEVNPVAALGAALCCMNMGHYRAAEDWGKKVLGLSSAAPSVSGHAHALLGTMAMEQGDFESALEHHLKAWFIGGFTQSLYALARNPYALGNPTVTQAVLEANEQAYRGRDRIRILFAKGHLLKRQENLNEAYENFNQANTWLRKHFPYPKFAAMQQLTSLSEAINSADGDAEWPGAARYIYVIGLPRCGSTLTGQMLAWKTGYVNVGESQVVPNAIRHLQTELGRPVLPQSFASERCELFEQFSELVVSGYEKEGDGTTLGVIDKQLWLAPYVGWLLRALKNSIVLWLSRHPGDQFISNYTTLFGDERRFNHHADDFAHAWHLHERMMLNWQMIFPERVISVRFEGLVNDPSAALAPVLNKVDSIRKNAKLEEFYKHTDRVSSASDVQVRQKLNKAGIGRWETESTYLNHQSSALQELINDYSL